MIKGKKVFIPPTHEEIAAYAFQLWEAEGRQHGRDMDHWLQAEAHLLADRQYEAGVLKAARAAVAESGQPVSKPQKPERRKRIEVRQRAMEQKQAAFA